MGEIKNIAWALTAAALVWGALQLGFSDGQVAFGAAALLALYVDRLERRIAHLEQKTRKLGEGH